MQDGAPSHSAASTKEELSKRGIITIFWPAYLPDLNLIKTIWNWMKDYIKRVYSDKEHSYNNLRIYIKEA
jgi:transposase